MGHIQGQSRDQITLFPESIDDYITADNPVRVIDAFVDGLALEALGFAHAEPRGTGRPPYDPGDLLKLYIYGYLNRVRSSRALEREAQRNVELVWLLRRLVPDFKTIADFRKDSGRAIQQACRDFIGLCKRLSLFGAELIAIDGAKFKAVNSRSRNFTEARLKRRLEQIDAQILRATSRNWMSMIETTPRIRRQRVRRCKRCSRPCANAALTTKGYLGNSQTAMRARSL